MVDHQDLPERRTPAPHPARRTGKDLVERAGLASAGLTLLALDYAALDDLLTTADPIYPELFVVVGSIPLLALLWQRWKRARSEE